MSAVLAVHLGNGYGVSNAAIPESTALLERLTSNQWEYYLNECLPGDELILQKLAWSERPQLRWFGVVEQYQLDSKNFKSKVCIDLDKGKCKERWISPSDCGKAAFRRNWKIKLPMKFSEDLERTMTLLAEIENQTDRRLAIIGATWVEEELLAAIKSKLRDDAGIWKRLFGGSGPLATFAARIDVASLLNIIDLDVHSDLPAIRKVRNEFAHEIMRKNLGALGFGTPHISDRCFSLRRVITENRSVPRMVFVRARAVLYSDFYLYAITGIGPISVNN